MFLSTGCKVAPTKDLLFAAEALYDLPYGTVIIYRNRHIG